MSTDLEFALILEDWDSALNLGADMLQGRTDPWMLETVRQSIDPLLASAPKKLSKELRSLLSEDS